MEISVSVVEDDAPSRKMMVGWVNNAKGFKCVSHHASGESALDQLPGVKPNVVLMDINLPGMNGMECVSRLKPVLADTQFVMLTVYEDSDHIFRALQSGASGYLLKETPRAELFAALENVHQGGSPMTSNIARKVVRSFQMSAVDPAIEDLSPREREVLDLLARAYLYKEIADALDICVPTVNTYIRRIYEKLHVRSRAQAVAKYSHGHSAGDPRQDAGGHQPTR